MPDIRIRWSDNTQELTRHLREGLNQIEATKASAEKMVQALGGDKLLRAAHNYTAAVQQMGGADKLTAAEKQRINTLLEKAIEKYRVLGREAPDAMRRLAEQTRSASGATSDLITGMSGAGKQSAESLKLIAGMSASGRQNIAGLATQATGLAGVFGKVTTALGPIGGVVAGAFTVTSVVRFGRELLNTADSLVKMSDKTGISVTGLQRLQVAGDDAGNTVDQLTTAVNQMQNRLASGDASALAALDKVGLSIERLRALAPDEQFMAIADAIRQVEDPAQQVALAMDLFGRTGAEVLPTIKRGFEDLRDTAPGMSEAATKALDETGDAIERLWRRTKGAVGEAAGQTLRILGAGLAAPRDDQLAELLRENQPQINVLSPQERAELHAPQGAAGLADPLRARSLQTLTQATQIERELTAAVRDSVSAYRGQSTAIDDNTRALERREQALKDARAHELAMGRQAAMPESLRDLPFTPGMIPDSFAAAQQRMASFTTPPPQTAKFDLSSFFEMGRIKPPDLSDVVQTTKTTFADLGTSLAGSLAGTIAQAFTGGGGLRGALNAIGAQIGGGLFGANGPLAGAMNAAKGGLSKIFGSTVGGAFAAAIPGIGALIGPGISALIGGIKKIFGGPSQQELEGRDIKKQFQDSFGGFEHMLGTIADAYVETGRTADMARADVERLMEAEKKGADAVKAVIADINTVFVEQQTRWEGVQESVADLNAFTKDGVDSLSKYNIAAGSAVAIFDAWVEKTGDVAGALERIGPALDELSRAQTDLGIAGNEAIDELLGLREVTQAQKPLMDNIGQSTRLLQSLGKAGVLTEDLLMSFGQNAVNQFTLLKNATGDSRQAMILMQPELQALWQHQQKFGDFADEATRALIKQAEEQGIVGPEMKSINEQILDVMKDIRDVIADATGQTDRFKSALDKLPDEVEVDLVVNEPDMPTLRPPDYETGFAARGGLVTRHGIQHFADSGLVRTITGAVPRFRPQGTDIVPAMLTPGELVLNAAHQANLAQALDANAGSDNTAIVLEIKSLRQDVRGLEDALMRIRGDAVVQIDGREVARAVNTAWDNGGSLLTDAQETLGRR